MSWLPHVLGLDDASGRWYLWWSGACADLGYLAIVGTMVASVRRHSCHVRGCWRLGRHPVEGTGFMCCAKHAPGVPRRVTHSHIVGSWTRARSNDPDGTQP